MLWTFVFVAVFVVLGLGVVLAAMRTGRRRKTPDAAEERRRTRLEFAGFALLAAVALAVPALLMVHNATSQSKEGPTGRELTQAEANGRTLFVENCATCHTLAASNSVGRVGPNLDQLRPPKALVVNAIEEGRARGQGQMPANLVTGQEAEEVGDYIVAVAGR